MAISEFFRNVDWRSTGILVTMRLIAGSLVLVLLVTLLGDGAKGVGSFLGMFIVAIPMGLVAVAVACIAVGLGRAGVPWVGLFALPAWLWVGGDPIIWGVTQARPELVPIDKFSVFNRPVLFLFKDDAAIPSELRS